MVKVLTGQRTVAAAGTRVVVIPRYMKTSFISIKPLSANTGIIYIGTSGVSSTEGFELRPDTSERFELKNFDISESKEDIWLDSSVSGEGVSFIIVTKDEC